MLKWVDGTAGGVAGVLLITLGFFLASISPLGGSLVLAAGVFLIPFVRRELTERTEMEFSRGVVVAVVIAAVIMGSGLVAFASAGAGPVDPPAGTPSATSPTETPSTPLPDDRTPVPDRLVHDVGESFVLGSGTTRMEYAVTDVATTGVVGGVLTNVEADGVFVVVVVDAANVGEEPLNVSPAHFAMVGAEGREFRVDPDELIRIDQDPRIETRPLPVDRLEPGDSVTGALLFDVPNGTAVRLRVDSAGRFPGAQSHYVRIGTIGSDG